VKTKAFGYLRTSGLGQSKGDGFNRQRDAIKRYAKANRIEVVQEFADNGVSGTKDTFDRDGLTALFVALKSNGVRLVLVENADRLARDLMVSEIILAEFRKIGVNVVAADSGTDLSVEDGEPTRKLVRQILAAISEFDKTRIVQKLRAARIRVKKTKGVCEGRKPYGETDEEKAIVAKMLQWSSEGATIAQIADRLNADGVKPRMQQRAGQQSRWHATSVQRCLARAQKSPLFRPQ
jgi:DNA invertase Pin-like site-specific DNA recombinase